MAKPKPYEINAGLRPDPSNPHSWFTLIGHPPGETAPSGYRVLWGVMRPEYRDYRPSLAAFAQTKLAPAAGTNVAPWAVTAYRHEVLLPAFAGDHLRDPRVLIESAEQQPVTAKALASYITLTSTPATLHGQFEVARRTAQMLVARFDVAALLVQHVPALNGGSAQPHVHLIIPGPRRLTPWSGYGAPVAELAGDKGRDLVLSLLAEVAESTATHSGKTDT